MKKHLDIAKYDPYWKWAKKIRYVLSWTKKQLTSKEIANLIIFQDRALGYSNQGTVRTLESKTAGILKIYFDRGEVDREFINDKYTYRLKIKKADATTSARWFDEDGTKEAAIKYCRPCKFQILPSGA